MSSSNKHELYKSKKIYYRTVLNCGDGNCRQNRIGTTATSQMSTKTGSKIVLLWATKVCSPQLTPKQVRTDTITPCIYGSNLQLKAGFGIGNQNYYQGSVSDLNQKVVLVVNYTIQQFLQLHYFSISYNFFNKIVFLKSSKYFNFIPQAYGYLLCIVNVLHYY